MNCGISAKLYAALYARSAEAAAELQLQTRFASAVTFLHRQSVGIASVCPNSRKQPWPYLLRDLAALESSFGRLQSVVYIIVVVSVSSYLVSQVNL